MLAAQDLSQSSVDSTQSRNATLYAWLTVMVAALGYFVDVVDLWLFANFRVASLNELGVTGSDNINTGAYLMNCQQVGLLLGGIIWGLLGDKRGRASVMFGSIFLYSLGNILNAFVQTVPQYAALRFLTGIGLAGEIGAGITLVCEILPKHQRGIGTTIVTGLGVAGAIVASVMGKYLEWRNAFMIGGVMGLTLLTLRIFAHDSGMFQRMCETDGIKRGSLSLLFSKRENLLRFLSCIAVGVPIYLTVGIFATFSPEISIAIGMSEPVIVPEAMLYICGGMTLGDISAGLLSQVMQKRKLPLTIFVILCGVSSALITAGITTDRTIYLWLCGSMGFFSGYWACLITTSAEQFGTNIRATVATMIPNLVRSTAIILNLALINLKAHLSIQETLWILVIGTYSLTFVGLAYLKETFHRDLSFYEK